jgi:DNA-binding CsgD family transcriptional regulator
MLEDRLVSVLRATDVAEFRERVLEFTKWVGFDLMSAAVVVDVPGGHTDSFYVDNAPDAYRSAFEDRGNWQRDPVTQHCKRSGTPILWKQETYLEHGVADKWEEQARFGYRTGIGLALHLPHGKHFMLAVDRDQSLPSSAEERRRVAAELCLFAAYAHVAALRLLVPQEHADSSIQLSRRELEVLQWTMAGKTAWEVGRILCISEQTVTRHAVSAAQKLGCVNKVQAVAKALRLGLLG